MMAYVFVHRKARQYQWKLVKSLCWVWGIAGRNSVFFDPTTRGTKVIIFQILHIGACTTDKTTTLIRGSILDTVIFPPT